MIGPLSSAEDAHGSGELGPELHLEVARRCVFEGSFPPWSFPAEFERSDSTSVQKLMKTTTPRIRFPELFFGFVAPIGSDLSETLKTFESELSAKKYKVVTIKVTNIFKILIKYLPPRIPLDESSAYERYNTYIAYGDQLREHFDNDSILAATAIAQIIKKRIRTQKEDSEFVRTAYLIHQFKRKEEIDLLRAVYGRLFFQVSVYSRRGARSNQLSRVFAKGRYASGPQKFKHLAEKIIQQDEHESEQSHGQRVAKIFHDADFIVNRDLKSKITEQVNRFCELIFGSNAISPNKMEYGMFMAKAAALRTLDLSRQVGAAIFTQDAEIISLGSNEVPKAGGGTYWCDEVSDDREHKRGIDSNFQRKRELLTEIIRIISPESNVDDLLQKKEVVDSQFMDALEYGRIVHAEMSAIADAARLGRSTTGAVLFCTTFPCHMCAKHIIAAGVLNVIFLEPYPKSLAFDLHADALEIEGGDRGEFSEYKSVKFDHFYGITPRRYRELFERGERKNDKGEFSGYINENAMPIVDIKFPYYQVLEDDVLRQVGSVMDRILDEDI